MILGIRNPPIQSFSTAIWIWWPERCFRWVPTHSRTCIASVPSFFDAVAQQQMPPNASEHLSIRITTGFVVFSRQNESGDPRHVFDGFPPILGLEHHPSQAFGMLWHTWKCFEESFLGFQPWRNLQKNRCAESVDEVVLFDPNVILRCQELEWDGFELLEASIPLPINTIDRYQRPDPCAEILLSTFGSISSLGTNIHLETVPIIWNQVHGHLSLPEAAERPTWAVTFLSTPPGFKTYVGCHRPHYA